MEVPVELSGLIATQLVSVYLGLHTSHQVDQAQEVAAAGEQLSAHEYSRWADEINASIEQAKCYYVWDIP